MARIVRCALALIAALTLATPAPFAVSAAPTLVNAASASYDPGNGTLVQVQSPSTLTQANPSLTVTSAITACQGGPLTDYTGWSIGLYSADALGNPTAALALTRTQLPVLPAVPLPAGIAPNNQNLDPFTVTNGNVGIYAFLLDTATGETAPQTFVLITNAPATSSLPKRRIKIVLGATTGANVAYTATALDNMAVNALSPAQTVSGTFPIVRTSANGSFAVFQLAVSECPSNAIGITKTANVTTAQVGDTVVYSVAVTNQSLSPITAPTITDILPLGFVYVNGSVRAGAREFDRAGNGDRRRRPSRNDDHGVDSRGVGADVRLRDRALTRRAQGHGAERRRRRRHARLIARARRARDVHAQGRSRFVERLRHDHRPRVYR